MKIVEQPEWSLLHGIMKGSLHRKLDTEEAERRHPNQVLTGDYFYDYIGKFCNSDAFKQYHQSNLSFISDAQDEGENLND